MSSTFSLSRLGKLITKQLFENARLYMFTVLAMLGLLALAFSFWIIVAGPNYHEEGTYILFILGLFISGCVFASMSFNMLGDKDKGIYWLSVPATHLEKLICTIFYTIILFTLVYCLCFYMVKLIGVSFLEGFIKKHPGTFYIEIKDFKSGFASVIKYFLFAYFAVQSLYLLGSVYFSRYSFVVTTVVGAAVIFAFAYYIKIIGDGMDGNWRLISLRKFDETMKSGYSLYSISPTVTNILKYAVQYVWAPLFWIVTWFRLKEKQI
ncbi:MAG: hypothetical protein ABIN89_25970 [Chitinophagaceae bacterium]